MHFQGPAGDIGLVGILGPKGPTGQVVSVSLPERDCQDGLQVAHVFNFLLTRPESSNQTFVSETTVSLKALCLFYNTALVATGAQIHKQNWALNLEGKEQVLLTKCGFPSIILSAQVALLLP